jgi:hypothetical protein
LFLVPSQVGTKLQETEQERLERLYGISVPSVPANVIPEDYVPEAQTTFVAPEAAPVAKPAMAEAAPAPEKGVTMFNGKAVEYDPVTDTYVELATGRRVRDLTELNQPAQAMYRGGLMALAQRYR